MGIGTIEAIGGIRGIRGYKVIKNPGYKYRGDVILGSS